jgi:MobA/MobL family
LPTPSRPHLTIHNRAKGHSAVAAAAYRLGMRLLDRRTDTWHDFTKRKLGQEIIAAMTVAPDGSPEWACDPDALWNNVEACEQRRDAQIARDYVVPIPRGLGDQWAAELARRLGRYISDTLKTPVSIGLHRDADTDLYGEPKPADKNGYHAHFLFPTRKILLEGEKRDPKDAVAADHGFGVKVAILPDYRTSSGIVREFHKQWDNLATELAAEVLGLASSDHRSFERSGTYRPPQPRRSWAAMVMEKKGVFTEQRDRTKQAFVASKAYQQVHADALAAQHAQAILDLDQTSTPPTEPVRSAGAQRTPSKRVKPQDVFAPGELAKELACARERGRLPEATMEDRFVAHASVPKNEAARQVLFSHWGLAGTIQSASRTVASLARRLRKHREMMAKGHEARIDRMYELDAAHRRRREAKDEAGAWLNAHNWRPRMGSVVFPDFGGLHGLSVLDDEIARQDQATYDLAVANRIMEVDVAYRANEERDLQIQHDLARTRLTLAVEQFVMLDRQAVPALMAVLSRERRSLVERLLPPLYEPAKRQRRSSRRSCRSTRVVATRAGDRAAGRGP